MKYIQDQPNTVKVEFSEGCNLACSFCGINSIRERPGKMFNFLSVETAARIASEVARIGWRSRFEFSMHGEPSLNPQCIEILRTLRSHLPKNQLMMTSNGAGFLKDPARIDAAFTAGLNILVLDDYKNVNIVPKILERYKGSVQVHRYPASLEHSPYRRYPTSTQMIVIFLDISLPQNGVHNRLDNMGGCAAPKVDSMNGKRCARPFRELAIRWNGYVATCCDDWRGQYVIGNVMKTPLDVLWQNDEFMALRKKMYYGQRDFGACDGCSDKSYRVGLLPDKLGKKTLPKPTARDAAIIKAAVARGPLANVVLRPWEKKTVIPVKVIK